MSTGRREEQTFWLCLCHVASQGRVIVIAIVTERARTLYHVHSSNAFLYITNVISSELSLFVLHPGTIFNSVKLPKSSQRCHLSSTSSLEKEVGGGGGGVIHVDDECPRARVPTCRDNPDKEVSTTLTSSGRLSYDRSTHARDARM